MRYASLLILITRNARIQGLDLCEWVRILMEYRLYTLHFNLITDYYVYNETEYDLLLTRCLYYDSFPPDCFQDCFHLKHSI